MMHIMTSGVPPSSLSQSQLLRLYRRTFADLHEEVDRYSHLSYISKSIVDQIELEMEDADPRVGVPLPRWPSNGFATAAGQYPRGQISDFLLRVIRRLDEAVAAHAEADDGTVMSVATRKKLASQPAMDPRVSAFVEEALLCFDVGCFRAAVVLSWCGAVALLQDYTLTHHIAAFNTEATRRDPKWKPAQVSEDFGRMREFDFLQILEAIGVLTRSVKTELEACLRLRNSCGHPTELRVADAKVAAHVELLVLNVFALFSRAG